MTWDREQATLRAPAARCTAARSAAQRLTKLPHGRPVEVTGFTLKPVNFFGGNPGIDIPPERNHASKAECCKQVSIANGNGGSKL